MRFIPLYLVFIFILSGCKTAHTIVCGTGDKSACTKEIIKLCPKGHKEISYTAGDISKYSENTLVAKCRD